MDSIMERWVQTCRRELLDRTLIWNRRHLLHALREVRTVLQLPPAASGPRRTPAVPVARTDRRSGQAGPPRHTKTPTPRRHPPRVRACCVTCTDEVSGKCRVDLGRTARRVDAYARGLAEYLQMCERDGIDPVTAGRAGVAKYGRELTARPGRRDANARPARRPAIQQIRSSWSAPVCPSTLSRGVVALVVPGDAGTVAARRRAPLPARVIFDEEEQAVRRQTRAQPVPVWAGEEFDTLVRDQLQGEVGGGAAGPVGA
jgi:hypothetical protein